MRSFKQGFHRGTWFIGLSLIFVSAMMLCPVKTVLAADKNEIVVGATLPLTGMLSMMGSEQKWAYEQAVADLNATGGIYVREFNKKLPVKLIVADNETDAGKAVAAVERLIKIDKVNFLLSDSTLPLVMPTAVAVGSKDYSSQILKLKSKGIDGTILFAGSGDCVTFVRQMKGLSVYRGCIKGDGRSSMG
jgi:ABC-type branched-subunit amino acid transport system substrate-binding protein